MYYFPGYRKKVVYENLRNSFPEKSEKELNQIAKQFYANLADVSIETLKILGMSKKEIQKRVRFDNIDLPHQYLDKGQSIIVLTGHQCNWEWLLLGSSVECRYPIDAVYKPLHNSFMNKLVFKMRSHFGARPLAMKDVFRSIVRNKTETRALAMVADQTPAGGEIQYFTKFLNRNSGFFVGSDKIAGYTDFPVLFLDMRRMKRGYYEARFYPVKVTTDSTIEFPVVEEYAHLLEASILQRPGDWLWSHRRWKHTEKKAKKNYEL
jgi:KDO2-lipid IV(A) lauroyltransferase